MKKMLMLLVCGLLLCASGCGATAPAGETASPNLPIVEVPPEELDAKLAELSEGTPGESELFGYPIRPGYLADLNSDGEYELYMNLSLGSGICNDLVQCYDPVTGQTSMLNDRMVTDYIAVAYGQVLYIIARPYIGGDTPVVYRAILTGSGLACEDISAELQAEVLTAQED